MIPLDFKELQKTKIYVLPIVFVYRSKCDALRSLQVSIATCPGWNLASGSNSHRRIHTMTTKMMRKKTRQMAPRTTTSSRHASECEGSVCRMSTAGTCSLNTAISAQRRRSRTNASQTKGTFSRRIDPSTHRSYDQLDSQSINQTIGLSFIHPSFSASSIHISTRPSMYICPSIRNILPSSIFSFLRLSIYPNPSTFPFGRPNEYY